VRDEELDVLQATRDDARGPQWMELLAWVLHDGDVRAIAQARRVVTITDCRGAEAGVADRSRLCLGLRCLERSYAWGCAGRKRSDHRVEHNRGLAHGGGDERTRGEWIGPVASWNVGAGPVNTR